MAQEKTKTEIFIEKARKIHGDKYDYSKAEYINARTKTCIICPKHGEFWQIPYSHINRGCGCFKCGREITGSKLHTLTREECFNIASKYTTLKQFRTEQRCAYTQACRNGWRNDYTWLELAQKKHGYWNNYEICKEAASTCINVSEFKEKYGNAWGHSQKNGWINDFFPNKQKHNIYNDDTALEEAKKYNSKIEFKRNCNRAYKYVRKHNLMPLCTWFVKPKKDNSELVRSYIERGKEKYNGLYDYSLIDVNNVSSVTKIKVPIKCTYHDNVFHQTLYQHNACLSLPCPLCKKNIYVNNNTKVKTLIEDKIEYGIIYCYTDKENGKKYIGQSIREEKRKLDHMRETQKYKSLFDKILQKKGMENFDYQVLYRVKEKRSKIFKILNQKEMYYIKALNTQVPNGYNISEGGKSNGYMVGYKPTKETLQKLSDSHKGIPNPMKGKHYSDTKRKEIVSKWKNTMNLKYKNGYVQQRKNIVVFKGGNKLGTYPNACEVARVFNIPHKKVQHALYVKRPLENNWLFIYEQDYTEDKYNEMATKPQIRLQPRTTQK